MIRQLAIWGIQSLGEPKEDELYPGWLEGALDTVFAPVAPAGAFEFRVGDELVSIVDGEARVGAAEQPDVVIETNAVGFYWLFVERRFDGVTVEGDRELLERLLDAAAAPVGGSPVAA